MQYQEKIACVFPAAGCGERMGIETPKQFCVVGNKPLICHTLEAFLRFPWISPIIIVTAQEHKKTMQEILSFYMLDQPSRVRIVTGGETRHRSILAGIQALEDDPPDYVIIHDGVRPLVPNQVIQDLVEAVRISEAVGLSRPLVSTVIAVDGEGHLSSCLDRSQYVASEMPQAFKFSLIQSSYMKCSEHDLTYGTECLNLVLTYCNVRAKILPGPPELWKVTHKKDLYAAESMLKEKSLLGLCVSPRDQGSAFHKKLHNQLSQLYSLVDEGKESDCMKCIYIHGKKSVIDLIDNLASRQNASQKTVHITHDTTFLGHSDAPDYHRKAKTIACTDVVICCTCAIDKDCSEAMLVDLITCILKNDSWTTYCKILIV